MGDNVDDTLVGEKPAVKGTTEEPQKTKEELKEDSVAKKVQSVSEKTIEENDKSEKGIVDEKQKGNTDDNKTETILSTQSLKSSNPSISIPNDPPTTPTVNLAPKPTKDRHVNRNQSDILPSLKEIPRDEDPSLMIFSSKGLPTKKFIRRKEVNSSILPFGFNEKEVPAPPATPRVRAEAELTPKINQTVPKGRGEESNMKTPFGDKKDAVPNPSVTRNVLTGFGAFTDGNPVLGLGYEDPVVSNNIGRVPPGGFSSGLW